MFRHKFIMATFALATLCVACSDSEEAEETEISYPVELSIAFPEKDEAFQYAGWNEGKEIAAIRTDNSYSNKLVLTPSGGQTYTATSEKEISESTDFAFLYPASASTVATSDTTTQVFRIDHQDGTLDGLAQFDYAWGTYTYDTEDENYTPVIDLTSLMSFAKFQFMADGRPVEHISKVVITSPSDSMKVVGQLNLKSGYVSIHKRGSMTIRNARGLSGTVHAAFFPTETSLHFTLSTLDGKCYEAVLPEAVKLEAGGAYVYADVVCSPMQPARIGDYFYSDATWGAQLDGNRKCVGVVYALDDADGRLDKTLASSMNGRVVSLQDWAEKVSWCSTTIDVEGIDNQTVLQDTMYIGSLPYFGGTADSFFSDEATERLDKVQVNASTGKISQWYPDGALSDFEGEAHTLCVADSTDTYAAFEACQAYGEGLHGWYLPSEGELALLWSLHRTGVISNDTHEAFQNFELFGYWTSTEYDEGNAWYINFYSGITARNSKRSSYLVRPVIRF